MPREFFLVPVIGTGAGPENGWRPKYTDDPAIDFGGALLYGRDDDAIVMLDAPQAYLDSVAAQADATRLATEANLDEPLTAAQANAAKTIFEATFIPGQFINAGDTRRQALRGVCGMFFFSRRMKGRFGTGWKARAQSRGLTLDSTWQDFPQALKDELIDVRDSFGWTNAELGVTNTSTMREILQAVSNQFENEPMEFVGFRL